MNSKKNILLIIYNLTEGGAQRLASNLSIELAKNYNVYIVLNENKITYPYKGEIFVLNSKATKNLFKKAKEFVYRIKKIKEIKRNIKADCSISFLEDSNIINLCANCGDKRFISLHSDYPLKRMKGVIKIIYTILCKMYYKRSDKIIVVSKYTKKLLIDKLKIKENKIAVIYNFINVNYITKRSKEHLQNFEDIFNNKEIIINVGRLTYQKGQWYLIRGFKKIKEIFPNYKLIIIGDGDLRKYLLELSNALQLKTFNIWEKMDLNDSYDVYFLGFQENTFRFMELSKLFVFTSLWEGFPLSILEAMACSLPVISTDCYSGPREILAPNTDVLCKTKEIEKADYGILIPEGDKKKKNYDDPLTYMENCLVEATKVVLEDENLYGYYKEKSLIRANDFDKNQIINKWVALIERANS
jgi:glycosyltransferase involved in cell wall biosynthesis